jgi:two-component system, OmpR family, sensor histidine kinase CiaH
MLKKSRSVLLLTILFGYIIAQFLWWEVLLVKQTSQIIAEKQKLTELSSTNSETIKQEVQKLHDKKTMQVAMIVGEGTVFLLLLLFGIYKIKQAHDKEVKLNQQQQNFLMSITHELKTPLSVIKLQLQTLKKHQLPEAKKDELLQSALIENERLNTLIDNVLLVSRMDNSQSFVQKEKVAVNELIEEISNRYYKTQLDNATLILNLEASIFMLVDKLVFPSILTNLIDNAFKYSFDTKLVKVELKQSNQLVYLTISDCGQGISESDKSKIFERFFRAGDETTRQTKGTGLGLYIVNYLVKQHAGTITVLNNTPKGSIFQLTFPSL